MRTVKMLLAACAAFVFGTVALAAAPNAPANVVASTNDTEGIALAWSDVPGAAYYIVYRYGNNTSQIGLEQFRVTGTSFKDVTCEAGEKIPYRVRAFDAEGLGGGYSAYAHGYRKPKLNAFVGGSRAANPIASKGTGRPFQVECNVDWTAASSNDWIVLHRASFDGTNGVVSLGYDVQQNDTGAARSGMIVIRAAGETQTLTVWQGAVVVPGQRQWNGDSALAVIEEAACSNDFRFCESEEAFFLSQLDATAVGGSCLRTTPMTRGQRAVIAWPVPRDRTVTFSWRKDTLNAGDSFAVYEGDFTADGEPDLAHATLKAECASTGWETVTIKESVTARPGLFFVFKKTSSGTAETASGFGFLDNLKLETLPSRIEFLSPVTGNPGNYTLTLDDVDELTVFTEAFENHTVTYGGETHEFHTRVNPKWTYVSGNGMVGCYTGMGEDGGDLFVAQGRPSTEAQAVFRASYSLSGVTVTEDLTIRLLPRISNALDCDRLSGNSWGGWSMADDRSAVGGSMATSGIPEPGKTQRLVASFAESGLVRFAYRIASLAADETAVFGIDDHICGTLEGTGGVWSEANVYVGEEGEHTIFWSVTKGTAGESAGSGMSVDCVRFESLPKSVIIAGRAPADMMAGAGVFKPGKALADCAFAPSAFALTALDGDWLAPDAGERADGVYGLAFAADPNETGAVRSGVLRLVCGAATNDIRVVQTTTENDGLSSIFIEQPSHVHLNGGKEFQFSVSLGFDGDALEWMEGVTALDWSHSFGDAATIEGGLMKVGDIDAVMTGTVEVELAGQSTWSMVTLHPALQRLAPDGVTLEGDSWRVEASNASVADGGMYLQSHIEGNPWSSASLNATVTGPGVLAAEWKVSSLPLVDTLSVLVDGVLSEKISGADGDWAELALAISEGEHVVTFEYAKGSMGSDGDDSGFVRNLNFIPCVPTGAVRLAGPAALTSGAKSDYALVRVCTNEEFQVGVDSVIRLYEPEAKVTLSATNPQTTAFASAEIWDGIVRVRVPFAVEWADTLTLAVTLEDGESTLAESLAIPLEPVSLKDVLDVTSSQLSGFDVPSSSFGDIEVVAETTAATPTCVRMTSPAGGSWNSVQLKLMAMDAGTLSFRYRLRDLTESVGYNIAALKVFVDDNTWEPAVPPFYGPLDEWATGEVSFNSWGPHMVTFQFEASTEHPEISELLLDQLVWTSDGSAPTRVLGGMMVGPGQLSANEGETTIEYYVMTEDGSGTRRDYQLTPLSCTYEILSGDAEAVGASSWNSRFYVYANEDVTEDTVVRLKAYNTVAGVSCDAEWTVTVAARSPVDKAIFDAGFFDNCWLDDERGYKGWTGVRGDAAAGDSSARTVKLGDDEGAEMHMVAWGAGTLEFDWKVSSDAGDQLSFSAEPSEGVRVTPISGVRAGWQHVKVTFNTALDSSGENPVERIFRWEYKKNGDGVTAGEDCAWVDNVIWNSSSPAGIDNGYADVPWMMTPGSVNVCKVEFYRKRNPRKGQGEEQGGQDGGDYGPTTVEPLPSVTWDVTFSTPELAKDVSYYIDGSGNLVLSVAEDCKLFYTSFYVEAKYRCNGREETTGSTVNIYEGDPYAMSSAKTANGVPYVWLARQTMSGQTMDALAASEKRLAANGVNTLKECYVAGLDARDENAAFKVQVTMSNGKPVVTWTPNLPGRTYVVKGKASLTDPEWVAPIDSTHRFFKVEIEWNK